MDDRRIYEAVRARLFEEHGHELTVIDRNNLIRCEAAFDLLKHGFDVEDEQKIQQARNLLLDLQQRHDLNISLRAEVLLYLAACVKEDPTPLVGQAYGLIARMELAGDYETSHLRRLAERLRETLPDPARPQRLPAAAAEVASTAQPDTSQSESTRDEHLR